MMKVYPVNKMVNPENKFHRHQKQEYIPEMMVSSWAMMESIEVRWANIEVK